MWQQTAIAKIQNTVFKLRKISVIRRTPEYFEKEKKEDRVCIMSHMVLGKII